ncbi:DUF481 domain-containing protein [Kaarinaea lacus]
MRIIKYLICGCALTANVAVAANPTDTATTTSQQSDTTIKQDQMWGPPPEAIVKFDWIQLTSDEWLKGEFKAMYDKRLEFDSDELDLLDLDWEDIKQVIGHRTFSLLFENGVTVFGKLRIVKDKITVTTANGDQVFTRNQLISIAPGVPKEKNYWSADISLGFNISGGNTEQLDYSAIANVKRRTAASRVMIDYIGKITNTREVETANNHRVNAFWDRFKSRKLYWRVITAEYYRDPFQNIADRVTAGTGVGYNVIDTSRIEWDINAGVGYQLIKYDSVELGEDIDTDTPALSLSTQYEIELNKKVDFDFGYNIQIVEESAGRYTHHFISTLETELTSSFDFDVSFVWDRTQIPQPADNGTVPKQDDYYLIISLSFEY